MTSSTDMAGLGLTSPNTSYISGATVTPIMTGGVATGATIVMTYKATVN